MRVWQLSGNDNHGKQLECCQWESDNQWCLLQKISSVLSVTVLAPGGMSQDWRIPQQSMHLVTNRHWPFFWSKVRLWRLRAMWYTRMVCQKTSWRLIGGILGAFERQIVQYTFEYSVWIYIYVINWIVHVFCFFHSCTCMCLSLLTSTASNLNPAICLMVYSAIYRVVLWWQIIYIKML